MYQMAPKTRKLVDLFLHADYGTVFTYAEILDKTECDLTGPDRPKIYTVVKVLEREHQRTLANMRGRGYKVAMPRETVGLIEERKRRAGHHLVLAKRTGESTNISKLDANESRELANQLVHLSRVQQALAHKVNEHERDLRRHDVEIQAIKQRLGWETEAVEGSAEEVAS